MPSRREELLDAAIEVLGGQGVRGLTHRAVDAAAGTPAGATANYFKTRESLLGAIAERFAERDAQAWEAIAGLIRPTTSAELAAALTAYVQRALGPDRAVTVARFGLFVEAALRPDLQERLAGPSRELRQWATEWLSGIGSAEPAAECNALMDYLDGLMLHHLAFPPLEDDLKEAVTKGVRRLCTYDS
ncbi:TetR family transcriptional regulator [Kineosporia rhizophila]|uniref:TetR/AcrR family transcriptional regulator n=1 Tax=Kineosporia rhizophila TaxID=84633 RepID=UPI000AA339FD|nr:TetR family transcriptional regulator [Kineosporia rhizophila]